MTFVYIFFTCILYLLLFTPLPYLAYKNKHYKIFLILGFGSVAGYFITSVNPPFPPNGFNEFTWMKVMKIFVLPVYLIGLLSWIVLIISTKIKGN
ncbi:hypothetical protein AWH48_14010 [Domibacillus aminovorans]|uniref:Uncharacterized protein n=1 Tax=Domibacillus aminovorans TaxID=29332 RepID=A0A177KIV7_9BACI|nr:hypothetical protein AWH48_14010 [Domibacillus aminovorans]